MTDQLSPHAVQNASLLRAIKAGGATSPGDLAQRAEILPGNVHRKLDVLEAEGLIVRDPKAGKHEAALTEAAERALTAIGVYEGAPAAGGGAGVVDIPVDRIDPWPANPRTQFDPAKTEELAVSIGEKGVLQAIKVRPSGDGRYQVIIGERRRRASALAVARGWRPAGFAIPCDVRDFSDEEAEEVAGVENMQREDMHWMDEAKWYLSLSQRHSGASIERLVGGIRGKRSIQDYIKCARELAAEDVAKTYLPDGDKDQLTYVKARDLVGEKKERPALELSPKLAAALLETLACGIAQAERDSYVSSGPLPMPALGATIVTRFAKAPAGGPLATLATDRKLIVFGFEAGQVVARTKVTEDVARWLGQLAFDSDPHGALWRARAAVVGELQTNLLEREGRCLTDELNAPPAPAATQDPPPQGAGDREAVEGVSPAESAAPRSAPAEAEPLPPMLAIVVVEAAHKISAAGLERGPGTWATPVLAKYYLDARGSQLVTGWKMLAFLPLGEKMLVALGKAGRDWLWEKFGVEADDGHCAVSDAVLQRAQAEFGVPPLAGQPYATYWLNPPAEADPAAQDPPPTPPPLGVASEARGAGSLGDPEGEVAAKPPEGVSPAEPASLIAREPASEAPPPAPRRDQFAADILAVTAESRAVSSLAAAARQAAALLNGLKARSKAPEAEEVDPVVRLVEAALAACAPYLPQGPADA